MKMRYWDKRLNLLREIQRSGDKKPLSSLSRNIVSTGSTLRTIINEMEKEGIILRIFDGKKNTTMLTEKGERLLNILEELNGVIGV